MGRPSPATKKRKRQRQKVCRKLKFADSRSESGQCNKYVVGRVLPDELGEDTDVVHMRLEDFYQQWEDGNEFSANYLQECRQQLIQKVEEYRRTIEALKTEKAKVALQHRKEIEEIRKFYQHLAYGTSRSGGIV